MHTKSTMVTSFGKTYSELRNIQSSPRTLSYVDPMHFSVMISDDFNFSQSVNRGSNVIKMYLQVLIKAQITRMKYTTE